VYSLNPMVGIIEGFRWCLLDNYRLDATALALGTVISFVILGSGVAYFRRVERSLADVI
jgi:lipopolysaccharide transport system permease protein